MELVLLGVVGLLQQKRVVMVKKMVKGRKEMIYNKRARGKMKRKRKVLITLPLQNLPNFQEMDVPHSQRPVALTILPQQ